MPKRSPHPYLYGSPTGIGPSLIMVAGASEIMGRFIAIPFKTPLYVTAFVKQLRSHPVVEKQSSILPQKEQEERIRKTLYELKHRKLIIYKQKKDGTIELHLTTKGRSYYKRISLQMLRIARPYRWDRRWRMVLFDIPEEYRISRDTFRNRLRQIGFFQIQKSVWVHAFECEAEIRFLAKEYNLEKYVLFYTITIENDKELRKHFKLA